MVALNFAAEFAEAVASKQKRQTFRRTKRCNVGDSIQLYTGQRTTNCRRLVDEDAICTLVFPVRLAKDGMDVMNRGFNHQPLIVMQDGFDNYPQMWAWFAHRYKLEKGDIWTGWCHQWKFAENEEWD